MTTRISGHGPAVRSLRTRILSSGRSAVTTSRCFTSRTWSCRPSGVASLSYTPTASKERPLFRSPREPREGQADGLRARGCLRRPQLSRRMIVGCVRAAPRSGGARSRCRLTCVPVKPRVSALDGIVREPCHAAVRGREVSESFSLRQPAASVGPRPESFRTGAGACRRGQATRGLQVGRPDRGAYASLGASFHITTAGPAGDLRSRARAGPKGHEASALS